MTRFAVDRSPRGLVVASGPDATAFLQSLLSQDLDPVVDGEHAPALLLTPQGKLDVALRALRVGDEWWLDTDAEYGPRLAAALGRFRIRVQVDLEDRTPTTGLASVVGVEAAPAGLQALPTRWGSEAGVDLLGPVATVQDAIASLPADVERWSPAQFEAFRIEAGVPRLGVDVDETTIPQEAFLEREAVSFTKGCFVGQELVCRIDTRGHVNRFLRGLRMPGPEPPPRPNGPGLRSSRYDDRALRVRLPDLDRRDRALAAGRSGASHELVRRPRGRGGGDRDRLGAQASPGVGRDQLELAGHRGGLVRRGRPTRQRLPLTAAPQGDCTSADGSGAT